MTDLCKKWVQCLPMWGKVLAHHENAAYPGWAELLSKGCPTQAYIPIGRVYRILPIKANS